VQAKITFAHRHHLVRLVIERNIRNIDIKQLNWWYPGCL
jgi:hypothetical protein